MAEGHGRCTHGRYPASNCKKCQREAAKTAPTPGAVDTDPLETFAPNLDERGKFIPPATGLWAPGYADMPPAEYALAIARWKAHMATPDAPDGRSVGAPVDTMTADQILRDNAVTGAPPHTTTPQGPHEGMGPNVGSPAADRIQTVSPNPHGSHPVPPRDLPPFSTDRSVDASWPGNPVGSIRDCNAAARQQAEQSRIEQELTDQALFKISASDYERWKVQGPSLTDIATSRANPTRPNPLGPIVQAEPTMAPRTLELSLEGHKLGGRLLVERCDALGVPYQVKMVGAKRVVSYFGTPGAMLALSDWMTAKGLNPVKVGEVELSPSLHQHRPPRTKEVSAGPAWGRELSVAFRKTDAYRLALWRDADGMYRLAEMVREPDGSWRSREHGQPDYFDVKQAQCTDILVEFWSP